MPDVPGWQRVPAARGPALAAAFRRRRPRSASPIIATRQGRAVDLAIVVFARQERGPRAGRLRPGRGRPGRRAGPGPPTRRAPPDGRAERIASHGVEREVVSFYRVGDIVTGSGVGVKLETLKVRLLGGPQRAVAVLGRRGRIARPAIDDFLAALGPVAPLADRAAGLD